MLWDELDEALKAGGWTADGLTELWALVAACLHTGNINFDPAKTDTATITADSAKWVENVEAVLGLPGGVLPKVLTKMKMKVGTEMMDKDLTFAKAVDTRDALAKGIFSRLFDKLIEQINTSMAEAKGCDRNATIKNVIGIVDIFGFEIFEKNSMEQLCINFANEKLQALFTKTVFAETMKAYKEEGIDVADITYSDNANLIKTFETPKTGLFGLLTEECILPKGTDEGFTEKVMATHGKGGIIFRMKGVGPKEGFGLNHFAGQVNYGTKAWLDKNRDPMSGDLVQLMLSADNKLLKELFTEKVEADAGGGGGKKKSPKFKGVMDTFTAQLNDLNGTLEKCALHFVRCFKTNDQKKKEFNEDEVVMRQLQTSGVLDALRVSREGYPDRMIFETFSSQYIAVPGLKTAAELAPKPPKERVDTLLERLEVPKEKFRSGKTRVFFAAGVLDGLRAKRTAMQAKIATEIQRVGRGLVARAKARELRKIREAALQAMVAATPGEDIEALRTAIKGAKDAGLPNYPAGKAKFDEAEKRLATLEAELKARKEAEAALEAAVAGTDIPALEAALKKAVDCKSDNKPLIERGEKRVEFLKEEERRAEEERKRKEEEERKLAELKAAAEKDASKKAELEAAQAAAAEAEKKSAAEAAAREAAAAGGDAAIVAQAEQEAEAVKAEEEAKQVAEETAQKTQLVKSQSRMLAEAKADPEHAAVAGDAAASAAASAVANGAGSDEAIKAGIAAAEAAEAEAQERAIQEKAQLRRATIDKLRSEEVKFHSLPEDVVDYADYLGMDLKEDLGLLWIADEALRADDPDGWIEREGPTGDHYYEHEVTGQVLYSHPLDYQFQQLYLEEKKKGGSGQLGRRNSDDDDDDMAPPKQARSSSRAALLAATGPVGSADDVLRRVQRLLGTTRSDELRQLLIQPSLCKTPVRCFVIRHKSFMGTPRFDFFMSISRTDDMYCFTAKKWPLGINKGCYYSISLDQEEAKRSKASTLESGAFVGKVRSDKKSLDYTLYDDGTSPDGKDKGGTSVLRHELLHINFSNSLRNRDPGAMTVVLPEVDSDGSFESVQPRHHTEGLEALLKRGEKGGLLELKNRQPKWNASSNMYVLDFHGRASLPSCRNVQLAPKARARSPGCARRCPKRSHPPATSARLRPRRATSAS